MGLRAALERRRNRKREAAEREAKAKRDALQLSQRADRAFALTPAEIAARLADGTSLEKRPRMWAQKISLRERTELVADIAGLNSRDRAIIALTADGWTRDEISRYFYVAVKTMNSQVRILEDLSAGEDA